LNGETVASKV